MVSTLANVGRCLSSCCGNVSECMPQPVSFAMIGVGQMAYNCSAIITENLVLDIGP